MSQPAKHSVLDRDFLRYLPMVFIVGWWVYDLHFQWRALVEYRYGWLVVMLVAYLMWERWRHIPTNDQPASLWFCCLLVLVGTPFVLAAELYKQGIANPPAASFALSIGCALYLAANILYLRGWKTLRFFLFPLLFVFLAVPLPNIIWNPVIQSLQRLIVSLNVEMLNLIGIPATQHVNVIQLPHCVVGIDEACSGIRSLQSSIMASLFIGYLTLTRTGSRLAFFVAGILVALTGNFLRSFSLSLTAHERGIEALHGAHDIAGWSILIFTVVSLIAIAWLVGKFEKSLDAGAPT
jgi:exosortase